MSADPDPLPAEIDPPALEFVEKISRHYENVYSVPHSAARILGLLLVVPGPVSMEDITRLLRASHGSISTNLHLLELLGYVEKLRPSGQRCALYRFLPRSRVKILQQRVERYRELKELIETNQNQLDLPPGAAQHLAEMVIWSELAIRKFSEFIDEWEDYFTRR
jgi:DNA-binding transcriptional regulator GbsR (MarR family)